MKHEVLLVAMENRFGVARLPTTLNAAHCRITVLGNRNASVCWSRYVDRVIPCEKNKVALGKALIDTLARWKGARPWVIFTDEMSLETAVSLRGQPRVAEVLPVDASGPMADIILRKTTFMAAAEGGFPIPPMRICRTEEQAVAAGRELVFPLFMKRDVDSAGGGVIQVHAESEIPDAFFRLKNAGAVLVQEMIHGRLAKANAIYHHGKPMCWNVAYARKTWPGKFGPSCVREYFVDPQIDALVQKIGELAGFHGLCGFDCIRDSKTGKFIVIEFNGRITPHYHLGRHTGVNYSKAIADFLDGRFAQQRPRIRAAKPPVIYIFPQDVRRCLAERDFRGLLKWLPGMSEKDIPWRDANLIVYFLRDFLKLAFARRHVRLPWDGAAISLAQAQSVHPGVKRSEVIQLLGSAGKKLPTGNESLSYRMFDGRLFQVGLSGPSPAALVTSVSFQHQA